MRLPATAKWVLLALVGLAIAIGVAIAAANLASQQIGIAAESVSAGDTLAPALHVPAQKAHPGKRGRDEASPPEGATVPAEPAPGSVEEIPRPEEPAPPEAAEPPSEAGGERESAGGGGDGDD